MNSRQMLCHVSCIQPDKRLPVLARPQTGGNLVRNCMAAAHLPHHLVAERQLSHSGIHALPGARGCQVAQQRGTRLPQQYGDGCQRLLSQRP